MRACNSFCRNLPPQATWGSSESQLATAAALHMQRRFRWMKHVAIRITSSRETWRDF